MEQELEFDGVEVNTNEKTEKIASSIVGKIIVAYAYEDGEYSVERGNAINGKFNYNGSNGTVSEAEVILDNKEILWTGGKWKSGLLASNCIFMGGVFEGGVFDGLEFGDEASFIKGDFKGGTFAEGAMFKGGKFMGGTFDGGAWIGGQWEDSAMWVRGFDKDSVEHTTPPPWNKNIARDDQQYDNFSGTIDLFGDKATGSNTNPNVKNATFEKQGTRIIWKSGIWKSGTWLDGVWEDGTWESGVWTNGIWDDGEWKKGTWMDGTWNGGEWLGGEWKKGKDKNGIYHPNSKEKRMTDYSPNTWQEMIANKETTYVNFTGDIHYGNFDAKVKRATFSILGNNNIIWKSGIWKSGTWVNGTWSGGKWISGIWKDGSWCGGTWEKGLDANGHVRLDSPDNWNASDVIASRAGSFRIKDGIIKFGDTNGRVMNATVTLNDNGLIDWSGGVWLSGTLSECKWKQGSFVSGVFVSGTFSGGNFENGLFNKSTFDGGSWIQGTWSESSTWKSGTDHRKRAMSTPPSQWIPPNNNLHHPNRDMLINDFVHYGSVVRTTFTWDEKKPNAPKIYKIYQSGVIETINPFRKLIITTMVSSPDHIREYFQLPEYHGLDDDGKPMVGNPAQSTPANLIARAKFFREFDNGEWLENEPDIPKVYADEKKTILDPYYQNALVEMKRRGLEQIL